MNLQRSVVDLFPHPMILHQLRIGITEAIDKSFTRQKINTLTQAEVKRRFDICLNWAVTLRGDLGWGTERIIGAFDEILLSELNGHRYEPSQRQVWVSNDGA